MTRDARPRTRARWLIAAGAAAMLVAALAVWFGQTASSGPATTTATATATPTATPSPTGEDLRALAQRQLDSHLKECTAEGMRGGVFPAECGIEIPWGTDFTRVDGGEFRIERLPVLDVTDDGFVAAGGVLVATLTGVGHDGGPRTETYRTETWSVRGDLSRDGERLALTVW